jgi:hypothetical protein
MAYLRAAVVGLLVGALYALMRIKSPAPPLIEPGSPMPRRSTRQDTAR